MSSDDSRPAAAVTLEEVACLLCGSERRGVAIASGNDYEYETSDIEFKFVACADCGHVYLNPRPTMDSASAIYPSNYYSVAGAHSTSSSAILGRLKDMVVSRRVRPLVACVPEHGRFLEAGCGDGSLLIAIRKARPDLEITGLDFQFTDATRAVLASHDIDVHESTLEDARFDEPFDMVVMNQLIEHLWDARRCMRSLNAALRDGGVVSISTPNLDGYDRGWCTLHAWGGYHFPRHLNLFTAESLGRFLAEFGFEPVRQVNLVAPLVWLASVHNTLKIRGNAMHRLFTDSNLAALAVATIVDLAAAAAGRTTSNQQLIVRKMDG